MKNTDMVCHDGYTWHYSGPNNKKNYTRKGLSVRFMTQESKFDPRPGQGAAFTKQVDLKPGDMFKGLPFPNLQIFLKSVAIIILYKKHYALQLRDVKKNIFFPGLLGLFGGGIEKGETALMAIKREVQEELNIDIKSPELFLKTNIYSKKFKNPFRERSYYTYKINKRIKDQIKLNEGKAILFKNFKDIDGKKFAPWDYQAIQFHQCIEKKVFFNKA